MTMVTFVGGDFFSRPARRSTRSRASGIVLCIFQFPTISRGSGVMGPRGDGDQAGLLGRAAMPGSALSSSNSRAAPPPVEMKDMLSDTPARSEEHTSELQSQFHLVCRLLLEKQE